jgi:molybdopterin molybdotransferase
MIRAMLGLGKTLPPQHEARLAHDLDASGPREHYMRAEVKDGEITPEPRQDSALLSVLANANALMIRPAGDGPRKAGDVMQYLPL